MSENRVLVVIITNAGRVEQRVVVFTSPLAEDELATVRKVLNDEPADLQLPALQAGLARAQARPLEGLRSSPAASCRCSKMRWEMKLRNARLCRAPRTSPNTTSS